MLKHIRTFINGMTFGLAQIIPGISGGTIAVILGFYDRLLESVNQFSKDMRKSIMFLVPFVLGIAISVVVFSSLVTFMLANFSLPVMTFFIGMIAGIIPIIYAKAKEKGSKIKPSQIAMVVIPALLLIFISHIRVPTETNPAEIIEGINAGYMVFLLAAGFLSAAALITPGISGSFILLLMGVYHVIIFSVSSVRVLLTDITNTAIWLDLLRVMLPFGIGVLLGVLVMARVIEKLLNNYTRAVYSVILGLLLGSVYALLNDPITYNSGITGAKIAIGVVTFVAGTVLSYAVGKREQ